MPIQKSVQMGFPNEMQIHWMFFGTFFKVDCLDSGHCSGIMLAFVITNKGVILLQFVEMHHHFSINFLAVDETFGTNLDIITHESHFKGGVHWNNKKKRRKKNSTWLHIGKVLAYLSIWKNTKISTKDTSSGFPSKWK